jgi:hypothetical protein
MDIWTNYQWIPDDVDEFDLNLTSISTSFDVWELVWGIDEPQTAELFRRTCFQIRELP